MKRRKRPNKAGAKISEVLWFHNLHRYRWQEKEVKRESNSYRSALRLHGINPLHLLRFNFCNGNFIIEQSANATYKIIAGYVVRNLYMHPIDPVQSVQLFRVVKIIVYSHNPAATVGIRISRIEDNSIGERTTFTTG